MFQTFIDVEQVMEYVCEVNLWGFGMGESGRSEGEKRDFQGLKWIWDFGWLRPQELGKMLWPEAEHATKYAERLCRKWIDKGYVIARQLPDHNGTAFTLSAGGALFLEQRGVQAKTGKDFGETEGGRWIAPHSWRHDLQAAGLLALLHQQGAEVIPEKRLRRENPSLKKIPDGIVLDTNGRATWLEVERSKKGGEYLSGLAAALIQVARGDAPPVSGQKPVFAAIAAAETTDGAGHVVDHEKRVKNAIQRLSEVDIKLIVFRLGLKGAGVISASHSVDTVEADAATRLVAKIDSYGWDEDPSGRLVTVWDGFEGKLWQENGRWHYSVSRFEAEESRGSAATITAAKRGMVLSMLEWSALEIDRDLD